jgi:hypothetical protein
MCAGACAEKMFCRFALPVRCAGMSASDEGARPGDERRRHPTESK